MNFKLQVYINERDLIYF